MKIARKFDIALADYTFYQDDIKSLYPGEHLTIEKSGNKLLVKSYKGTVGKIFAEDTEEITPYVEQQEKYYLDAYVKKFYTKEYIKLAVIIIIDVYEKSEDFKTPKYEFLGDYTSESGEWMWGETMDDDSTRKISVIKSNDKLCQNELSKLDEWDEMKFVINNGIIDVYSPYGCKVGELPKKMSDLYIPIMRNPDRFLTINVSSINQNDNDEYKCRLEVSIYEKKRPLYENKKTEEKKLKKEGVNEIKFQKGKGFSDRDREIVEYERKKQKEEQRKKENQALLQNSIILIIIIALIIYLVRQL